ncbi:MAG: endopeptidase La [Tepidisphaerales bacterium]
MSDSRIIERRPDATIVRVGNSAQQVRIPHHLPLLPIRNIVVFPGAVMPLNIGRRKSKNLLDEVMSSDDKVIGVISQRNPDVEEPTQDDLYAVGVACMILKLFKLPDGNQSIIVHGLTRFRIRSVIQLEPFLIGEVEVLESASATETLSQAELDALVASVKQQAARVIELSPNAPDEAAHVLTSINQPDALADFLAANLQADVAEKQKLLEELSVARRLQLLANRLATQLDVLELQNKIATQVKESIDKSQRRYYLQEQLKAIRKELGEGDGNGGSEVESLRQKLIAARLPEAVMKEANRELARLESIPPASPEYGVIRTYLQILSELPWSVTTPDKLDLVEARRILDRDHFDLDKVKRRILEYLAVRKLVSLREQAAAGQPAAQPTAQSAEAGAASAAVSAPPTPSSRSDTPTAPSAGDAPAHGHGGPGGGAILCFVGPPGVGKTSLGKSIAEAMNRKFIRVALGGVRDEADIRGHRRTYIGSMPGRIIAELRKAGSRNPVMMLDEIDKLGADFRGDPAAALLEVLDPAQNHTFTDHYLDVPFDLSKVLFIATANSMDPVPGPLRDRMEVIEIPGYTDADKLEIARKYLVPRQLEVNGLTPDQARFTDDALRFIIEAYTREAGVRNLERCIGSVARAVAAEIVTAMDAAGGASSPGKCVEVDRAYVANVLGPIRFEPEIASRTSVPGVATGLAYTPVGGEILFIEASRFPGKGNITLTGHIGDVMRESATAAYTLVRARADELGVDPQLLANSDFHIHVPAGAVPKDGPSAGVAMFVALASLLTGRPVRHDVAMTGEITLRGLVLPIGGVKEKVLAASRAGIREVILPARNEKDLQDIPPDVRQALRFHLVRDLSQVLQAALAPADPKARTAHSGSGKAADASPGRPRKTGKQQRQSGKTVSRTARRRTVSKKSP